METYVGSLEAEKRTASVSASQSERRFRNDALRRRLLAGADALALLSAAAVLLAARDERTAALLLICSLPVWLVLAKLLGLYDRDHRALRYLTVDELPTLLFWALCGSAVVTVPVLWFHGLTLSDGDRVEVWLAVVCSAFLWRAAARALWRRVTPHERVLVVGTGALAAATSRKLELFPDIHSRAVATIDDSQELLERTETLDGIDRVLVASENLDGDAVSSLLPICRSRGVKLTVVPPARGMFGAAVTFGHVADLPVLEYNTWDVSRSTRYLKRVTDIVGATIALAAVSPFFVLAACAIVLNDGFPVFFRQDRAGLRGAPFRMFKFRTMHRDAEAQLAKLVPFEELDHPMFKLRDDPRVTRVGRVLRRTSFDEAPQLFNVLRGDMSLVGPRPEQLDLVELYRPEDRFRLAVRPGLTGPMQVYGRGELTFEERLALEREYIDNLSVLRDVRILFMTISAVTTGRGAF